MEQPYCFGLEDYQRCYILPPQSETTLLRHYRLGDYGAHEHARGVLVELLIWLEATAVSLGCADSQDGDLFVVTAVVDSPAFGRVHVETRRFSRLYGPVADDSWAISVDGQRLHAEDRRRPPSPRYTGMIVRRALRDGVVTRPAAPAPVTEDVGAAATASAA